MVTASLDGPQANRSIVTSRVRLALECENHGCPIPLIAQKCLTAPGCLVILTDLADTHRAVISASSIDNS